MKELKTGFVSAFVVLAILWIVAPSFDLGSNRDLDPYIVRWQTSSYDPTTRPEVKNQFLTTATDTLGSVRGLLRDTTAIFEVRPYMTVKIQLSDTSASDSTDQTLLYYSSSDNQFRKNVPVWSEFVLVDSVRVQSETLTAWKITASAIPIDKFGFIIARGNAANNTTSPVFNKLSMSGSFMR